MSARERSVPETTDALFDVPLSDDAERVESEWLFARANDPGVAAPSLEIANAYAELEDLLCDLPLGPSDEPWHDQVLRAIVACGGAPRSSG